MISRREVVTAGVLGTLAGSTAEAAQDDAGIIRALNSIQQELQRMSGVTCGSHSKVMSSLIRLISNQRSAIGNMDVLCRMGRNGWQYLLRSGINSISKL